MLILASTSRYRQALLTRVGIPFTVMGSDYDERMHDRLFEESPSDCATQIAQGKAFTVLDKVDLQDWVLAADQIVWRQDKEKGRIQFHKPGTEEAAIEQLMQWSGHEIFSTTGIMLVRRGDTYFRRATTERMSARAFKQEEAQAYVEKYKPLDCAGSFRMEDAGITLFDEIRGDWTGCQGFPLLTVTRLLRLAGLLPT